MSRVIQIVLLTSIFWPFLSFNQDFNRDSLQRALYLTSIPSEKIIVLNSLAESWMSDDPLKAYKFAEQALSLSETIENKKGRAKSLFYMGQYSFINEDLYCSYKLFFRSA